MVFLLGVVAGILLWVVWLLVKISCSIRCLNAQVELGTWINVSMRIPKKHGFIEVMVPESHPSTLVTKVVMFNGNLGGIKFWRPIKETEK